MERKYIFLSEEEILQNQRRPEVAGIERMAERIESGQGCGQRYLLAKSMYKRILPDRSITAWIRMGLMHAYGRGGDVNGEEAFRCFQKVAEQSSLARCYLGMLYAKGLGIEKNEERAKELFHSAERRWEQFAGYMEKAFLVDDAEAKYLLSLEYINQEKYKNDIAFAVELLEEAAEQGHKKAMLKLVEIYMAEYPKNTDMEKYEAPERAQMWEKRAMEVSNKFPPLSKGREIKNEDKNTT